MINGFFENDAPMCFQHVFLLLYDFLPCTYLTFTPGFQFCQITKMSLVKLHALYNFKNSANSPNSMPTTPLPCAIAERFQVSVTYIFASHKWKFENRKRCLNCQYSPTENSMSTGFQVCKYYFHRVIHKPEFLSSLSI